MDPEEKEEREEDEDSGRDGLTQNRRPDVGAKGLDDGLDAVVVKLVIFQHLFDDVEDTLDVLFDGVEGIRLDQVGHEGDELGGAEEDADDTQDLGPGRDREAATALRHVRGCFVFPPDLSPEVKRTENCKAVFFCLVFYCYDFRCWKKRIERRFSSGKCVTNYFEENFYDS